MPSVIISFCIIHSIHHFSSGWDRGFEPVSGMPQAAMLTLHQSQHSRPGLEPTTLCTAKSCGLWARPCEGHLLLPLSHIPIFVRKAGLEPRPEAPAKLRPTNWATLFYFFTRRPGGFRTSVVRFVAGNWIPQPRAVLRRAKESNPVPADRAGFQSGWSPLIAALHFAEEWVPDTPTARRRTHCLADMPGPARYSSSS